MSNSKVIKTFKSLFGAEDLITATQYIAEFIISKQAKFLKVTLPQKFWADSSYADWKKKYLNQKRRADALVKAGYDTKVILRALMSERGEYICSLFNKNLDFNFPAFDHFAFFQYDYINPVSIILDLSSRSPQAPPLV